MTTYETKREQMRERDRIRKQERITEFMESINKIYNSVDSVVLPSVTIKKEAENNYITYHVTKYPTCFQYSISLERKEYPFETYYSKKYFKHELPKKYEAEFMELVKLFPIDWQE